MTYRVMSVVVLSLLGATACDEHAFVFQPDTDRAGTHLQFTVETPSKVDILFVIDNSSSTSGEQQALKRSIGEMLAVLAPRDTSYRIGITSTSVPLTTDHGFNFDEDCCGNTLPPSPLDGATQGNAGNCLSCGCVAAGAAQQCLECPTCDPSVQLRRPVTDPPTPPHDGARGRLIAAYDPAVFKQDAKDAAGNYLYVDGQGNRLSSTLLKELASAFPQSTTDATINGAFVGYGGIKGARWVIDRESIRQDACKVCSCDPCDPNSNDPTVKSCFDSCAKPIAQSLVKAYFDADVDGLGVNGYGYEQGLLAGLLAVGIDPRQPDPNVALNPAFNLTGPGGANTFPTLDATGQQTLASWIRDDASLAIMFVSDEQDCSLPSYLLGMHESFENKAIPAQPFGSMCYQANVLRQALDVPTMAKLVADKKGSLNKVVIGFIGGVQPGQQRTDGTATDCVQTVVTSTTPQPSTNCAGLTGATGTDATGWLQYTTKHDPSLPTCDAMKGSRYVDFADQFPRHTFGSICRNGPDAFGPALTDFANRIVRPCFDLHGIRPANDDPQNIEVRRSPRNSDTPLQVLPMLAPNATTAPPGGAWTYDAGQNEVCLDGLDRLIGDKYDIFVLQTNMIDYSK